MPSYELTRCPVCHGAETQEIAGEEAMREEVEALWEFHTRRLVPETPPDRLTDRVSFSQRPPWRLVRCVECGTVYRNPTERALELHERYAGEAPSRDAMCALLQTQRHAYSAQAERLTEVAGRAGSGLEVGSYVGGFLAAARERGWRFEGVDVNPHASAFVREQGFTVHEGTLETFEPDRTVDAVAIWNCFDQLPAPRSALLAARRIVREGGIVAIRVPNGAFYSAVRARLDGVLGGVARAVLAHNNLLSFPYRHGFTVGSLSRLLGECRLEATRTVGDALVPIADEWTRGWAAAEERALKRVLTALARAGAEGAPWFEVYARAR